MSDFTESMKKSLNVWRMDMRLLKAQAEARLHHINKMDDLLDEYSNIENLPYYEVFDLEDARKADLLKIAQKIEICFKAMKEI